MAGREGPELATLLASAEYGGGGGDEEGHREDEGGGAENTVAKAKAKSKAWLRDPSFFCTGPPRGYQRMTVPRTGWFRIEGAGASSRPQKRRPDDDDRRRYFGLGAVVAGEFHLQRGATLLMVVGFGATATESPNKVLVKGVGIHHSQERRLSATAIPSASAHR